jgi:hypothetical protein
LESSTAWYGVVIEGALARRPKIRHAAPPATTSASRIIAIADVPRLLLPGAVAAVYTGAVSVGVMEFQSRVPGPKTRALALAVSPIYLKVQQI